MFLHEEYVMKKVIKSYSIILLVVLSMCTGCKNLTKVFWQYDCVWYSEKPYIYMPANDRNAVLNIDGVRYDTPTGVKYDGTGIFFYDNTKDISDESAILWEAKCELKDGKLYLTIVVDNISDYEGKTIELIQIPYDETTEIESK